jgi:hypothetical protein
MKNGQEMGSNVQNRMLKMAAGIKIILREKKAAKLGRPCLS